MVVHFNLGTVDGFMQTMTNQKNDVLTTYQLINGINRLQYQFTYQARIHPFADVTQNDLVKYDTIGDGQEPFNNLRIQGILEHKFTEIESECIRNKAKAPINARYFESMFYYEYDGPYNEKPIDIFKDVGIDAYKYYLPLKWFFLGI